MPVAGLQRAVKFRLPDGGTYFETSELDDSVFECLRLPYPLVALESDMSIHGDTRRHMEGPLKDGTSTRRITLCWESDSTFKLDPKAEARLVAKLGPGIFFHPVSYGDDFKSWTTGPMGTFSPRRNTLTRPTPEQKAWHIGMSDLTQVESKIFGVGQALETQPIVLMPEYYQELEQNLGRENAFQRSVMDTHDEFCMLLQFCIMLSCQNVITATQTQTTAAKNEKRIRNGKLPLCEYKILELKSSAGQAATSGGLGDSREGPRCHLRRGNIRRLESERRIWVRAAVVGNPHRGVIEKEYDARRALGVEALVSSS